MQVKTFDKLAAVSILLATAFSTVVAITSWTWFPTPGDWGDIARIPNSLKNYLALLSPPTLTLSYLLIRRWYFKKEF